ncbi:MAG: phospho-sugar mutase [Acidimicrobiia bacterium]
MNDLEHAAEQWIAGDPDPQTRAELAAIVASHDLPTLVDRMAGTLRFGTAGIRGAVEAGPNRMNRAVVIRTTAGLAAHLAATVPPGDRLVVVGRDARPSSSAFMEDTIGVLVAAGFMVRYFADPTPTPLVAYAGLTAGACASIVITASHNPPADNGYKVYASNGIQIIAPTDTQIAEQIEQIGPANGVPRAADPFGHPEATAIGPELFDGYLHNVATTLPGLTGDRTLSIVYTPLHGVGGKFVTEALRSFGFKQVTPVARQFAPDGTFPTVAFPNPEEPGTLDLAHDLASAIDADLVIANDPDTDRLGVSVPDPGGVWRPLTGNQIGCLLAEFLLSHHPDPSRATVVNSVVSSPLLGKVAEAHGATWARSLTGFKWIWNAALDLQRDDVGVLALGYEEALGYSVGTTVRDKDGISAALAFALMAAVARSEGKTVLDLVGDLFRAYGISVSDQVSLRTEGVDGVQRIAAAMDGLRTDPPRTLGGRRITAITDFLEHADERPRYLGATNLIEFGLEPSGRILARPSGTEPKLKIYIDLDTPFPACGDWMGAAAVLAKEATDTANDLADRMRATIES